MSIAVNSCSVDGCKSSGIRNKSGNISFQRGLCQKHYGRLRKYGGIDDSNLVISPRGQDRINNHLYWVYTNIKNRCYNSNHPSYVDYGARGIVMHEEWLDTKGGFLMFADYINNELGEKPSSKHSLDRINNDGNYEPGNLRWASRTVQIVNQRTRIDNTSGHTGVYYDKRRKKWSPQIKLDGKRTYLGFFSSKEDAFAARVKAEKKYFAPLLLDNNQ